jgi:hypothetical protein
LFKVSAHARVINRKLRVYNRTLPRKKINVSLNQLSVELSSLICRRGSTIRSALLRDAADEVGADAHNRHCYWVGHIAYLM